MILQLADIIYTPENVERARQYLVVRKIDSSKMLFPPALTDNNPIPFYVFKPRYFPHIFIETLFFPVVDIENPKQLIGFETRYIGNNPNRIRYNKFKHSKETFLLYFTRELDKINSDTPIIVTEGIIDAETIRDLGFPIISPLTALHSFKFCLFLKAISNNIYFAYDMDESGRKATNNILQEVSFSQELQKHFKFLSFTGKDLNFSATHYGKDYLLQTLKMQIQG